MKEELLFLTFLLVVEAYNVTYDRRSLQINGERKLIISAAIHYPRSVSEVWFFYFSTFKVN